MRPLFLIQSHKEPAQLARLARVLRRSCPNSQVLISHDIHATPLPASTFGGDRHVHIIEGKGGRGDFEIVDGYLAALRWARENIDYDWVTNLSGQDYPVSSLAGFAAELAAAEHDGFLHHFDAVRQNAERMHPMHWPPGHGYGRYYFRYRKIKATPSLIDRAALKWPRVAFDLLDAPYRINTAYGLMIGRRAATTPFTEQFRCYAGSYWHTIRRRCADYLLDFTKANPDIVGYMRRVLIPDESFIQTVLVNEPRFRFVNDNRRYYNMSGSRRGHPQALTADDAPAFLGKQFVFARKFETTNGAAFFDRLDDIALSPYDRSGEQITRPAAAASAL
jgi:hypothetical protein